MAEEDPALWGTARTSDDTVQSAPATSSLRGVNARSAVVWIGLLISVAFGYFAFKDAPLGEVWAALKKSDYRWLIPAFLMLAGAFFIRVVRWRSTFSATRRPPLRGCASALFIGYLFNNILPARAGEAARVLALNRRTGAPIAETTATVFVERAFDVLSLLLLLFVTLAWLPNLTWIHAAGALAAVLLVAGAGAIAALAVFGDRPLRFAFRQLGRLRLLSETHVRTSPATFLHGLAGLQNPTTGIVAFAWTTLSWLVLGLGFWLVMLAFDLSLSPLAGLLVVIAIGLAMIIPSSPGALGVFEGATVVALGAYGVPAAEAVSYGLVLHALNVVPFLALSFVVMRPYRVAQPSPPEAHERQVRGG